MNELQPDSLNDTELMYAVKDIIFNKIDSNDRVVFLLYIEYQSMQKVGVQLHVSATTVYYIIKRVREKVIKELKERNICYT